ncbi:MAG: hypothetical protein M1834_002141 [Cirrosporium novae-zelandiae]|nr:MAG: hypothetical protein M1834_002141 [Cirrosporium novae-zelandiae]
MALILISARSSSQPSNETATVVGVSLGMGLLIVFIVTMFLHYMLRKAYRLRVTRGRHARKYEKEYNRGGNGDMQRYAEEGRRGGGGGGPRAGGGSSGEGSEGSGKKGLESRRTAGQIGVGVEKEMKRERRRMPSLEEIPREPPRAARKKHRHRHQHQQPNYWVDSGGGDPAEMITQPQRGRNNNGRVPAVRYWDMNTLPLYGDDPSMEYENRFRGGMPLPPEMMGYDDDDDDDASDMENEPSPPRRVSSGARSKHHHRRQRPPPPEEEVADFPRRQEEVFVGPEYYPLSYGMNGTNGMAAAVPTEQDSPPEEQEGGLMEADFITRGGIDPRQIRVSNKLGARRTTMRGGQGQGRGRGRGRDRGLLQMRKTRAERMIPPPPSRARAQMGISRGGDGGSEVGGSMDEEEGQEPPRETRLFDLVKSDIGNWEELRNSLESGIMNNTPDPQDPPDPLEVATTEALQSPSHSPAVQVQSPIPSPAFHSSVPDPPPDINSPESRASPTTDLPPMQQIKPQNDQSKQQLRAASSNTQNITKLISGSPARPDDEVSEIKSFRSQSPYMIHGWFKSSIQIQSPILSPQSRSPALTDPLPMHSGQISAGLMSPQSLASNPASSAPVFLGPTSPRHARISKSQPQSSISQTNRLPGGFHAVARRKTSIQKIITQ